VGPKLIDERIGIGMKMMAPVFESIQQQIQKEKKPFSKLEKEIAAAVAETDQLSDSNAQVKERTDEPVSHDHIEKTVDLKLQTLKNLEEFVNSDIANFLLMKVS
jgi:hypothetical protein